MIASLFWLAIAGVVYTFLGYPVLIGLLARWRPAPVRRGPVTPSVTVLIPAYNEEAIIASKVENTLGLDYPAGRLTCAVAADGSTDRTAGIVASYAGHGVRLYHVPERRGKAAAVNRVTPLLESEIVVYTDANAMLAPGALRALVSNFADPAVAAVAGEKRVAGGGEGLYWRYESYLKRCDSAVSSAMGGAGELLALRRELFQPVEEDSIIEDFVLSLRLVADGWRVVYEPQAVAEEEASPSLQADWQRRTRIAAGGFQAISRLPGLLNPARGVVSWQYLSHRVLRWAATPFLLPAAYLLNLALWTRPFYRLLALGQTAFYLLALIALPAARSGRRLPVVYPIFYFCFSNAAALAGFWRVVRGKQPVTWTKVR